MQRLQGYTLNCARTHSAGAGRLGRGLTIPRRTGLRPPGSDLTGRILAEQLVRESKEDPGYFYLTCRIVPSLCPAISRLFQRMERIGPLPSPVCGSEQE